MRTLSIVGNWKMNTTPSSAEILAYDIQKMVERAASGNIIICPPFVALDRVSRTVYGSGVRVGAQDVHPEASGAFTGEVSPSMVAELAEFVIVGHSERRQLFDESDELVAKKLRASAHAGLRPILCVGESLEDRQAGRAEDVVTTQLLDSLRGIQDVAEVLVAYEPVWAIGTGEAANPQIAQHMLGTIRSALKARFGTPADLVPCLYGGSVTADNIQDFVGEPDIDGALVGGASLDAESFVNIVTRASEVSG